MAVWKQITALFLCLVLIIGLCACKEEKKSTSKKKTNQSYDSEDSYDSDDSDGRIDGDKPQDENPGTGGNGSQDFWENEDGLTVPPDTAPEETADEVADTFITALQTGDWETVNQRILSYSLTGSSAEGMMKGGIMEKILNTMTVKNQTVTDNGDGTYTVSLTIEAIDYKALLEALPETIRSKEAARKELLRLSESAERREFEGSFTLLRYGSFSPYYVEPDASFLNAITGGYYDLYLAVMEEVLTQ